MVRRLGASAAAVTLKLKDLAPYAVIALVVPGGALVALLSWLYRLQKRRRVFPDSRSVKEAASRTNHEVPTQKNSSQRRPDLRADSRAQSGVVVKNNLIDHIYKYL
jgi:hypothetical protein